MGKYYINEDGLVYIGDMQEGDRVATDEEVLAFLGNPIDNAKKSKIKEINKIYEDKASIIKLDTPVDEVSTWNIQKIEAEAYENDNTVVTPFIDGIATARQVDRVLLLDKVLEKTRAYNQFMAELTGKRQYFEDAIKRAKTIEELEAVVWI